MRPAHAVQLDWWVTQRNIINIWLPEGVFADDKNIVWFLLRDPTNMRWTSGVDGTLESHCAMKKKCEIFSRTTPRDDGVDLMMRVTNLSDKLWPRTSLAVCVQLATAPDFRDPMLERTYFRAGGSWRKFDPATVKQAYPGGCHFYGGMKPVDDAPVERPEIRVASRCGKWHLSHHFPQAVAVGGNCHETICCVHTNPILETIKPGESKEVTGWLRVRNEPVDAPLYKD